MKKLGCDMNNGIYYLPGRGGKIDTGLGLVLSQRGYTVTGREVTDDLARFDFQQQIEVITSDLRNRCWNAEAQLVAVSYGAYLLMHALAGMRPFPGKVLLLSPILGGATDGTSWSSFTPPRADRLMKLVYAGKFPQPAAMEVHVGDGDWQSNPVRVSQLEECLNAECFYAVNTGHTLGAHYVSRVLDHWLQIEPYRMAG